MKIHMIGIGGIGMSALARYYKNEGHEVTGSDGAESKITKDLEGEGIKVFIDHHENNIDADVDVIIYTVAVKSDNIELVTAHHISNTSHKKVKILTYAEALGEMSREKKVIAVCGSHGKTTTTAMAYFALKECGLDPSLIVGSLININNKNTNYVPSENKSSEWLIIEACEYKRSFLNYDPEIILVTNIDNDHLDYFKDIEEIKNTFQEFVSKLNINNENKKLIIHSSENFLHINKKESILNADQVEESSIKLSVPGAHNRRNAQLVLTLASTLGLDLEKARVGLNNFKGTWRRQEYKGKYFNMNFYDDYAHHPTEIRATLSAFREKENNKKIVAVFQPHLYSRTKILFDDFVKSFYDADEVLILPIYASRERFDDSINSEMLVQAMSAIKEKVVYIKDVNILKDYLDINANENKIVITLGAGDVYNIYDII